MGFDGKTVAVSGARAWRVAHRLEAGTVEGIEQFTELKHVHFSVHDEGDKR